MTTYCKEHFYRETFAFLQKTVCPPLRMGTLSRRKPVVSNLAAEYNGLDRNCKYFFTIVSESQ